jgi:hypothetical protein
MGISDGHFRVKGKTRESGLQMTRESCIRIFLISFDLRCEALLGSYLKIVEQRIKEALEKGEFDDLPGKGKPLALEDDSHIPEDLRIAYKILKNADCLPPEIQERKEIMQMEDMLASIPDDLERYKLIKKINYRIMKLNMSGKKSPLLEEKQIYFQKLVDKFAQK